MKVTIVKHKGGFALKILDGYHYGQLVEMREGIPHTFTFEVNALKWAEDTGYEVVADIPEEETKKMKKYEAAELFYKLMKERPEDFEAKIDSGRDHHTYIISHVHRAVSVNIDTHNNVLKVVDSSTDKWINYINHETMKKMTEWARDFIEKEKIEKAIDEDNEAINYLLKFYSR